jgi:L-ascorbate metabolism protein UlaG (beta-lactamase superfamily)
MCGTIGAGPARRRGAYLEPVLFQIVVSSRVPLRLVYLGCEGVLVRSPSGAVLIDGLFGEEAAPFAMPSPGVLDDLRHARPPFDAVDAVIATHYHGDHFNPSAVADYLRASPRARFVSTPQAVGRFIDVAGAAFVDRVYAIAPVDGVREAVEVNGIKIEGFGLSHGRVNYADVEQLGIVVNLDGRSVLHLGDGIIDEKSLRAAGVLDETADVGIFPFWFLTYPFGKRLLRRGLSPRAVFAVHIRVSEREQVVNEILAAGIGTPLTEPLARYEIASDGSISREG